MRTSLILGLAVPASAILAATALSYSRGSLPGTTGIPGTVPNSIVRSGQSCAQCHTVTGGVGLPTVSVTPDRRSLDIGQSIQVSVDATGGVPGGGMPFGGFVAETTGGVWTPAQSTKTDAAGKFITHTFAFWGHSWQFGFTAPQTPGLFEWYVAANTADGDGTFGGDSWSFLGTTQAASAPQRMFVNAVGTSERGAGCAGGTGVVPVLGSTQTPAVGSRTYNLELHGSPPSTAGVFVFGANPNFQIDLGVIGVVGCTLWVQPLLQIPFSVGPGDPATAGGSVVFPTPIPNNPALAGGSFEAQCILVDLQSGRINPLTLSNAVTLTIQ